MFPTRSRPKPRASSSLCDAQGEARAPSTGFRWTTRCARGPLHITHASTTCTLYCTGLPAGCSMQRLNTNHRSVTSVGQRLWPSRPDHLETAPATMQTLFATSIVHDQSKAMATALSASRQRRCNVALAARHDTAAATTALMPSVARGDSTGSHSQ